MGQPANSIYCASKWAIEGWAEAICHELGPFGITTNAVAPGWVDTEMSQRELGDKRGRRAIEGDIPTRRVATADDVGGVNGEIVNINGGSVLCG